MFIWGNLVKHPKNMTPQQLEAKVALLVYCGFGVLAIVLISYGYFLVIDRKRKKEQFRRRDHLLDQAALRLREFQFLYEQIWQKQERK